jgi:quinol monooxygenase YgiN
MVAPDSNDQVDILVWLKAKKGKEAALARELETLVSCSRAERGCLLFDVYHSKDGPGDFFIHEIWSSETELANHRLTPHFQDYAGLHSSILESRQPYRWADSEDL